MDIPVFTAKVNVKRAIVPKVKRKKRPAKIFITPPSLRLALEPIFSALKLAQAVVNEPIYY